MQRVLSTVTLAIFPTLYFFNFLYYTDAGSVFFTLFAYLMCLYKNHKTAALLGFCAFMFRQTNIVWAAFCAGTVVAQQLAEAWATELGKRKEGRPHSELAAPLYFLVTFCTRPQNLQSLLLRVWPYVLLGLLFCVFVVLNGGIVVGDRSSHQACLHIPQLFYFCAFAFCFSSPHLLVLSRLRAFAGLVWRRCGTCALLILLGLAAVWRFSYAHKYLLADNRHYTFYVWRRLLQYHPAVPYLLVPAYLFAGWALADSLRSRSVFWNLAFFACLAAAIVPQQLLEFRYFILPYLMYRLHVPPPPMSRLACELGCYVALNFLTFYVFLHKTFQWPGSQDVQRFMW